MCCIVPNKLYLCVIKVEKQLKTYSHESNIKQIRSCTNINIGRINQGGKRNIGSGFYVKPAQNFFGCQPLEYSTPGKEQGTKKIYLSAFLPGGRQDKV